jgi:hypothetical protein
MFFVDVAFKGLRYYASPLDATLRRGLEMLHLKDLGCTVIVQIEMSGWGGMSLD